MSSPEENLPAKIAPSIFNAPRDWGMCVPRGDFRTTFNLESPEQRIKCMEAKMCEADKPDAHINRQLNLAHVTISPAIKIQPDGEQLLLPRTVITTHDGEHIAFTSIHVLKSLEELAIFVGPPPWADGQCVVTLTRRETGGRTEGGAPKSMYRFEPVTCTEINTKTGK